MEIPTIDSQQQIEIIKVHPMCIVYTRGIHICILQKISRCNYLFYSKVRFEIQSYFFPAKFQLNLIH